MSEQFKRNVINVASKIALKETENGKGYCEAINGSLEKACSIMKISNKIFINMFTK